MPFEKGNQLWKKAVESKKERLKIRENFFMMLSTGGLITYGDLLDKQGKGLEIKKPQREFMDRVERNMEYVQAKLQRMEVTGKDGDAIKHDHIVYLPTKNGVDPNRKAAKSPGKDGG